MRRVALVSLERARERGCTSGVIHLRLGPRADLDLISDLRKANHLTAAPLSVNTAERDFMIYDKFLRQHDAVIALIVGNEWPESAAETLKMLRTIGRVQMAGEQLPELGNQRFWAEAHCLPPPAWRRTVLAGCARLCRQQTHRRNAFAICHRRREARERYTATPLNSVFFEG